MDRTQAVSLAKTAASERFKTPVFYKVGRRVGAYLRKQGYTCVPISQEAIVRTDGFNLDSPARRQLRRLLKKAKHLSCSSHAPFLPRDSAALDAVQTAWQARRGGERGLSMGRYCSDYMSAQHVICAKDQGKTVGFVSFHVSPDEWTLDLVRVHPEAPSGTAHTLVLKGIETAKAMGVGQVSLAAAPLCKQKTQPIHLRLLHRWQDDGLRQFKSSFGPEWTTLYMAAPSRFHLVFAAFCLALMIRKPRPLRHSSPTRASDRPHDNHENYELDFMKQP